MFFTPVIPFMGGVADWWLAGAEIDLDFENGRYYEGTDGQDVTDYLSCSRASIGYAQTVAGTLTQFASNELRITDLGLLVEDARTNVVLWNRDLTNAAWTASNITAAKNQTGPDGVTNSASSITATAGNGTILQAITLGSSARYQSAWVKRLTGSGTVNMTMDNGSTWTAITVTAGWTLVTIPAQTLANPTVGFRIVTSGDAIAVDFVQNEDGPFATSPIPTTTTAATRAADVVTGIGALDTVVTATPGSVMVDTTAISILPGGSYQRILGSGTGHALIGVGNPSNDFTSYTYNGSSILTTGTFGGGALFTTGVKVAVGWSGAGRSIVGGGTLATDGNLADPNTLVLGVGSSPQYAGYFRRLTAWTSRLADATLETLTTP